MNPERRAALFTPGKTSGHRVGQAAQGCNHWCTLHNNSLYPFPTWEAIMSCLTKTCCDKKLDTTHLRKEAASFAGSVVGQAEKAAQWAAPHVSKAAGGVARAAKDAQERLEPAVHDARHRLQGGQELVLRGFQDDHVVFPGNLAAYCDFGNAIDKSAMKRA